MPPKKSNNKKQQTKSVAPLPVDDEVLNNVKELDEGGNTDLTILTNGSAGSGDGLIESAIKTKRGSGRVKNLEPTEAEEQASVVKKPAAKGKGRKKKEVEVIPNENEVKQEIKEEIKAEPVVDDNAVEVESATKPKGKGINKKTKTDAKKAKSAKEIEKTEENLPEQNAESSELVKAEKVTKAMAGKRKKSNTTEKETEDIEVKQEVLDESVEKANKKSSRGNKKTAETSLDVEPQNKKSKTTPKGKAQVENLTSSEIDINEVKTETKKEKKPTKRGRNAAKPEAEMENLEQNGDLTEDVLPKKRSRKADSSDKKESAAGKPKKVRGKKAEKVADGAEEATVALEENDIPTNGDIKEEKLDSIEESPKPSKKTAKKAEPVDSSSSKAESTAKARGGGRKRAATSANKKSKSAEEDDKMDNGEVANNMEDEAEGDDSKPSKTKKKKDTAPLNATTTKYNKEDFELAPLPDGQTAEEPRYNLKISSWNVAGLRSWLKKEGLKYLEYEQPDIFCMQEIKCTTDQLPEEVERIPGYHPYWLCMPGGYAGVAIYSKIMPINVEYGIGNKEFDDCGRIITAEYEKFFLINVYVPNSGRKLVNLDARMKWEKIFQEFVQKLDARKPVVICGDMNVSHQEIDLANPKTNTRNAGFTKEERDKMTELLSLGYIDTFRHLYPDRKGAYTFWTYMGNARSRNVGWRLDYFIVSQRFIKRVIDNCIRNQCMGSDHCPITLFMKL